MEASLSTKILRRRRLDRSATIYGIIGGTLAIGAGLQWVSLGKIPVIEEFARQLGLTSLLLMFQLIAMVILLIVVFRGIRAVLRTRLEVSGQLNFQHDGIEIKKDKLTFSLSGESLQQFSLRLPTHIEQKENVLQGGCHLEVPSPHGIFTCEFELPDETSRIHLLQIVKHMEQEHQIDIELDQVDPSK